MDAHIATATIFLACGYSTKFDVELPHPEQSEKPLVRVTIKAIEGDRTKTATGASLMEAFAEIVQLLIDETNERNSRILMAYQSIGGPVSLTKAGFTPNKSENN